jgi:hypothetical protein
MPLYGSKCWTVREREIQKLQIAEMWFLRSVKGCTRLDGIKKDCIRKELGVFSVTDRIKDTDKIGLNMCIGWNKVESWKRLFGVGPKEEGILVDHTEDGIHRSWNRPLA